MASSGDGSTLWGLLTSGVDVDEAARRLVSDGADPDALAEVEAFVHALAADPTARDRALLLVERTRLLAERAGSGARASDDLRASADRDRGSEVAGEDGLGGVWRHELATPLAVADLALETLGDHRADPAVVAQMLEVARRNLRLAAHLLEGLGSLEDLRSGRVELMWAQVDLAGLVRECAADVRGVLAGQHELEVVIEQDVAVPADRHAVRQIVVNLLTNAAKFSPTDSAIELRVFVDRHHAAVAVRDHGRGFSPEDAERIFEAGGRLDVSTPGSGLGLFVARHLARAHGGELDVEHPPGGGSRFVLRLPHGPSEWQRSLERREDAHRAREERYHRRTATADARDDALDRRESVADRRDEALSDREALADVRDADLERREGS